MPWLWFLSITYSNAKSIFIRFILGFQLKTKGFLFGIHALLNTISTHLFIHLVTSERFLVSSSDQPTKSHKLPPKIKCFEIFSPLIF